MHKLKSWFWPNRTNHFHPHLLRPLGLVFVILGLIITNVTYNYPKTHSVQVLGYATSIDASEIISLSNQQRTGRSLSPLSTNSRLNQAAQAKAQDMINRNYWSHYAPDGTSASYFISNAGYSYAAAAENLAKDFNTSTGTVNAWMNSPSHRDNILNATLSETGVAVLNGVLNGQQTTLVVALYAAPKSVPAPVTPAPTSPQPSVKSAPPPAPATQPSPEPVAPVSQQPITTTDKQATTQDTQQKTPAKAIPEVQSTTGMTLGSEVEETAIAAKEQMNWARGVSVFMLSVLLLVTIMKHTIVWRTQRRGWRHIWMRAHPAAQYALIIVAIVISLQTGSGIIK